MLGAASGMIAGLVAVTPAAGIVGPMGAIVMGLLVSPLCYFFVSVVKNKFGYDDSADVFGIHGIGGIFGAHRHRHLCQRRFGRHRSRRRRIDGRPGLSSRQPPSPSRCCGPVSARSSSTRSSDLVVGLRVTVEAEREGLDLASHGEAAYHN